MPFFSKPPEWKSFFSGNMKMARLSQDDSIELTDMGSKPFSSEARKWHRLLREAVDGTSLRCDTEDILSNHGVASREVTFEMANSSCNKNRVPVAYVRVKGITGRVPRSTWFKAEREIAKTFLKRDLRISQLDIKPDMLAKSVEPIRRVKESFCVWLGMISFVLMTCGFEYGVCVFKS